MKREWKPGDVAMLTVNTYDLDGRNEHSNYHLGVRDNVQSWAVGTSFGRRLEDADVSDARPLVVIDPESREQVERLGRAIYDNGFTATTRLADALRSLITPPRPPEPSGLGAVVEDDEGTRWVRAGQSHAGRLTDNWRCVSGERVGWWSKWADIPVVRVLSEGVQP